MHYIMRNTIPHGSTLYRWGRMTHISVSKITIIGSENALSPDRRQAIIGANAGILLGRLGTNFSEVLIEIQTVSFTKMHLNISSKNDDRFALAFNSSCNCCTCLSSAIRFHMPLLNGRVENPWLWGQKAISLTHQSLVFVKSLVYIYVFIYIYICVCVCV